MEQENSIIQSEIEQKIYSYIGLATKAGKAVSGEFSTEKAIKEKKARLVLVSEESSENTKKKFIDSCSWYKIPIYLFGEKERLRYFGGWQTGQGRGEEGVEGGERMVRADSCPEMNSFIF